jgi:Lar family restriction alleviation protein
MSEELERCPFCRSSIVGAHVNDFHLHEVGCGACGCSGPAEASEAEAIAAWNRRAPAQPEPAAPLTWEQAVRSTITDPEYAERILALPDNATTEQIRAIRPEAAPAEPAPGWCKHCRQYTIEEPLQAAPTDDTIEAAMNRALLKSVKYLEAAPTVVEPVGWLEAPYGGYKQNPRYRLTLPPAALAWKIPLYTTPPRAALTDEQIDDCLPLGMAPHSTLVGPDEIRKFARAVIAASEGPRNE